MKNLDLSFYDEKNEFFYKKYLDLVFIFLNGKKTSFY